MARVLVVDVGSGSCKAGIAGEAAPRCCFPSVVGKPRERNVMRCGAAGQQGAEYFVGHDAQERRGVLTLSHPVEHGIVQDWEGMERIWRHTFFSELRVQPQEHPVLLTEPALNPRANREMMAQVMFDTFYVPALFVSTQAVLSLYSSGRTTGLVCDVGDGVSHVVPVYEGYCVPHAMGRTNLAGRDLTRHLAKLMTERGTKMVTSAEVEVVRDIKEKCCYVAQKFEAELASAKQKSGEAACTMTYEMPDGSVATLGDERFRCPEALFRPDLVGCEGGGLHQIIWECIRRCDLDIRREMVASVILSGGTTLLPGFGERIRTELEILAPPTLRVRILAPADRVNSVFVGGSMVADLDTFDAMCATRREYRERGPKIVHVKCVV